MIEWKDVSKYTRYFIYKNKAKARNIGLESNELLSECYIKFREIQDKYKVVDKVKFLEVYNKSINNMFKNMMRDYYKDKEHIVDIDVESDDENFSSKIIENKIEMNIFASQINNEKIREIVTFLIDEGVENITNEELELIFKINPKKIDKSFMRIKKEIKLFLEENFK